jgi:hypothetical protein
VPATPPRSVSIASVTSTTHLTLACLTIAIAGSCTQDQVQYTNVPSNTSVTFGAVSRTVWSDGVTTHTPVTGDQSLTRATVSGSTYTTIANTCSHTLAITTDYKYRCEAGGIQYTPVTVETISPMFLYNLSAPALSPTRAAKGSTITVSGTVQEQYSDGSFWPATTSNLFSIEFQQTGSTNWTTVVTPRPLPVAGSYSATFTLTGPGLVRTVVGSTNSATTPLAELTPSDEYQIGKPTAPEEVPARTAFAATASVQVRWSDDTFRNPPAGTTATLEFATSYDPAADPGALTWRSVTTAPAATGIASFTVTPQSSGFWRVKVGSASGPAAYTRVIGSAPLQLTGTLTPAPGEKPFVNSPANYRITSTLSGYVGTDAIRLFVNIGNGFKRIADFPSNNEVTGTYRLDAGRTPGEVIPVMEARTASGDVVASTTTGKILIDGIKSYVITVVTPTKPVREGLKVRVVASASGVSYGGDRYAMSWRGEVQLQRKSGSRWTTVQTKRNTRGSRLPLDIVAMADVEYRVYWPLTKTASDAFTINVLTPTGAVRLTDAKASPSQLERGRSTRVSVRVLAEFSDKKYYAAPNGTKVTLQALSGSTWNDVKDVFVRSGSVSTTVSPGSTTTYRFAGSQDALSSTFTVTVTVPQPDRLVVDWPSTYYPVVGARFTVTIKTKSGSVWGGTTGLQLSYRYSLYEGWRLLDSRTYNGRKLNWGWGRGPARWTQFRVSAPSLGLSRINTYGPR